MRFDDQILMAYADGELPALEAARVEAAMAGDPELAARVRRFRGVRMALRKVYDSVAAEPVPEHLRALLGDVATSEPLRPAQVAPVAARGPKPVTNKLSSFALAAIAAALIVGVIAGRLISAAPLVHSDAGVLRAEGALAHALDVSLSGADAGAGTRIAYSFRREDGGLCRVFAHAEQAHAFSGVACRDDKGWAAPFVANEIGLNGSAAPAVLALADTMIAGEPLDAGAEAEARAAHWR